MGDGGGDYIYGRWWKKEIISDQSFGENGVIHDLFLFHRATSTLWHCNSDTLFCFRFFCFILSRIRMYGDFDVG